MKHSHLLTRSLGVLLAASMLLCTGCSEDGPFDPAIGGDWRTWRGYSNDISLTTDIGLTFSRFTSELDPGCVGFAVYDAENGVRVATILLSQEDSNMVPGSFDFQAEDRDGDGVAEIGIPLTDGTVIWYRYGHAATWQENILEEAERSAPEETQ